MLKFWPSAALESRVFASLRQWAAFASAGLGAHWILHHGMDRWAVALIIAALAVHPPTAPRETSKT